MLVKRHMTAKVITVRPDASLWKAWQLLQTHHIRHLPVTEGRRVVGMLTDRTLRQLMPSSLSMPEELGRFRAWGAHVKVDEVMSRRIFSVTPETPVHEALRIMLDRHVGVTPVIKGSALVGILTTRDLLRALADVLHAVGLEPKLRPVQRARPPQGRRPREVKIKTRRR
ncbi:MAG: CBS domain-containing protein [candidate division NC10 bacterium]